MPFYEYRCSACGHQDSFLESMSAPKRKTCPECGARRKFERLISNAGFQLKGSGWYVTDFKDKGKKPAKETAAKDGKKAEGDKSTNAKSEKADKSGGKESDKSAKNKSADSSSDSKKKSAD